MIITTDNDNKHCRSRTLPATHPRAVTELFLVGKKWNDNSVENKFQTVNNMHNNMQTVFLCDWKGPHPAAQSPWQVLSHPHLLPYPAPSASCLVLNFLLYKPFVATLCGEINFKIKQTYEDELKRGGDLLSWNRWPFSRVIGVLLLSSCSRADHSLASQLILRTSPRKSWVFLWFAPSSTCHQGQALLGSSPEPSDGVTAHP